MWVKQKVYHCSECSVCILDFDHHFLFFDACIGGHNIMLWYIVIFGFLALLLLTMILSMIAM